MKKSFIILTIILLSQLVSRVYSQKNNIKLTGIIDTSLLIEYQCNELTIRIKDVADIRDLGQVYTTKISPTGKFSTEINMEDTIAYLSFEFKNSSSKYTAGAYYNLSRIQISPLLRELYLFQEGDSVNIEIKDNGYMQFSGIGGDKLNCQWQIYNTAAIPISVTPRILKLKEEEKIGESITLENEAFNLQIKLRLIIIESYKLLLSEKIYKLLYLDAISSAQHNIYASLPHYFWFLKEEQYIERIPSVGNYYKMISAIDYLGNNDSLTIIESAYYADMIIQKEIVRSQVFVTKNKNSTYVSFADVYSNIKTNYNGLLRDKLIYLCYQNLITRNYEEAKFHLEDALQTIKSEKFKLLLSRLCKEQFTATYPFKFYDIEDKIHRLSDYKGKVLIIDFWFTGCGPCEMLAAAMHPIYEKYKHNKEIVFITVSTDTKEVWLKSLASGRYTSNGMTNLHTNGEGFANSFISHYSFIGFPRQVIIDKKGEIVTTSPPRPGRDNLNVNEFEKIIDEHLSNK